MPLTKTGKKVMAGMKGRYGKGLGEQIFYASINKGTLKRSKMEKKR
jgi:hypothetical protein